MAKHGNKILWNDDDLNQMSGFGSDAEQAIYVSTTPPPSDAHQFDSGPESAPTTHLNYDQAGQQITRANDHWGATLGQPTGPITFGFRTSIAGYSPSNHDISSFSVFTASEQAAARAALAMWSSLSGITFSDQGNTNSATILFSNYNDANDGAEAFAFRPDTNNQTNGSSEGDVFMNLHYASTTVTPGSYEWLTMIHEIGHALGLQHPGDYNAGPGVTITYDNNAEYVEDSRQYTVMSYFDETNTGGSHFSVYNETPGLDDVAAIQRLYGANLNTRTGNTTYGFNSNAGTPYSITSASQHVVFTVYDSGGYDTLDFSGYSQNQTIDLNPLDFSSVGGDVNNVTIAPDSVIEYAYGGSGSDNVYGNDANNYLSGGNGNDFLKGGGGDDTLVGGGDNDTLKGGGGTNYLYGGTGLNTASYVNNRSSYTLSETPGGLIVDGPGGVHDTLHQIQTLEFNDVSIVDDQFGDFGTAGLLAAGGSVAGGMQFAGDHDWFAVSLVAGHHYVINELGSPSGGGTLSDPYLRLYNSGSTQVTFNDDGGVGFNSQLGIVVNTTGTYYVDAGSFSNLYTGSYTLALLDLGTSTDRFSAPTLVASNFGTNQGWTSENTYPRQLANMNGDDVSDIIAFGISGTYVALGNGTGFGASNLVLNNFGTGQGWSSQDSYPRLLADVNADGHLDIVGFGIAGTYVALGTGTSFGSPNFVLANYGANQGWNSQDTYVRELGDVNGDGRADIVAFGVAGTYVSLANTSGGFANPALVLSQFGTSSGWTSQDQYPRQLADVNGDHLADIVGFGAAGTFVSLATGGGNFGPVTQEISDFGFNAGGWTSNNTYPRLLADVNSDGKADVVGFGLNGIYVSLATGGGHFAPPVQTGHDMGTSTGWTSDDAYPRLLADVTGDGRADAVGFGIAGTFISQSHHDWIVV